MSACAERTHISEWNGGLPTSAERCPTVDDDIQQDFDADRCLACTWEAMQLCDTLRAACSKYPFSLTSESSDCRGSKSSSSCISCEPFNTAGQTTIYDTDN